jgi:fatty-acyl-CoA synthase
MPFRTSHWPAATDVPLLDTTVGGALRTAAEEDGDRPALLATSMADGEMHRWTYAHLMADAERVAGALLQRFEPGERVAVWAPNLAEWLLLGFGAGLAGIVLVTVNPALRDREVEYVLRQSRAAGVFHVGEFRGNPMAATIETVRPGLPELREAIALEDFAEFTAGAPSTVRLPDVQPGDAAQIQYTSGTTGFPKGALLHHHGITNNARLTADRWDFAADGVWINPMPLFHTGGCVLGTLGPVQARGLQVCVPAFEPSLVLRLIEEERGTQLGSVPTMLIALMEHPDFATRDLSSLRTVGSGGSTVPADLVRRIESTLGVRFGIVFGQTEASPVITQTYLDDAIEDKADTIGQPLPHTEVKIVDPATGETVPTGAPGELCTRGYLVMREYFEMPEATADAIDADGWLHTGDLCTMDERGYFVVTGRLKDMIIRGGENIYPREVEEVLFAHPAVSDVAVVGVPDEKWGEQVAAFVRCGGGGGGGAGERPTEGELFEFVRARLAPHKAPLFWVFVDDFPLTASGKVQKYVLREQWEKGQLRSC